LAIDALSGLGHACGHNLIAVSSMGAALATAQVVLEKKLGGKVVLFGTPAEGEWFRSIFYQQRSYDIQGSC